MGARDGDPVQYIDSFFRSGDGFDEAYRLKNTSWSIFGTLDFDITDRLTFTVGANYTQDRKRFSTDVVSTDTFSAIDLDAPQYAPFRNQLILGGALQQAGVNPNDPAAIAAFATNPATAAIFQQFVAFANANDSNPAANPLNGLKAFQFLPPFLNVPNAVEPGKTHDKDLAWSARLAYELTDTVNVYATYATGFKASSINLSRDSRPLASDLPAIEAAGLTTPNLHGGTPSAGPEEVGRETGRERGGPSVGISG